MARTDTAKNSSESSDIRDHRSGKAKPETTPHIEDNWQRERKPKLRRKVHLHAVMRKEPRGLPVGLRSWCNARQRHER
jgi:hypothetical protein